ncbi:MAG: hypothetical protein ACLFXM_17145 [Acidimicrobiia bacterium]
MLCDACGHGPPPLPRRDRLLGPLIAFGVPAVVLFAVFGLSALFMGLPPPSMAYRLGEPVEVTEVDCVPVSWSPRRGVQSRCTASWRTADGEIRSGAIYGAEDEPAEPTALEAREHDGIAYLDVGRTQVAMDVGFLLVPLVIGAVLVLLTVGFLVWELVVPPRRTTPRRAPP